MDGSWEGNCVDLAEKPLNESVKYQVTYGMKYWMKYGTQDMKAQYPGPCVGRLIFWSATMSLVWIAGRLQHTTPGPGFDELSRPPAVQCFGPEFDQNLMKTLSKHNMAQHQIEHMQIFKRTFHPLGHSKPPQVFSQQTATESAVTNTSDASGLSNFTLRDVQKKQLQLWKFLFRNFCNSTWSVSIFRSVLWVPGLKRKPVLLQDCAWPEFQSLWHHLRHPTHVVC